MTQALVDLSATSEFAEDITPHNGEYQHDTSIYPNFPAEPLAQWGRIELPIPKHLGGGRIYVRTDHKQKVQEDFLEARTENRKKFLEYLSVLILGWEGLKDVDTDLQLPQPYKNLDVFGELTASLHSWIENAVHFAVQIEGSPKNLRDDMMKRLIG